MKQQKKRSEHSSRNMLFYRLIYVWSSLKWLQYVGTRFSNEICIGFQVHLQINLQTNEHHWEFNSIQQR